jgi:hypothetical protein
MEILQAQNCNTRRRNNYSFYSQKNDFEGSNDGSGSKKYKKPKSSAAVKNQADQRSFTPADLA